ncbi:tetratricopeptide repeat protein [Haloferula sp. BvORR071]|uniref:tetratricopeptide repeat protein n=1 Tax=Haloferula sp. BvORR071 TaxID=1396141 RepID=UPI00054DA087|nr:tetratricopeptide repeat protein [Haloferula sp. BvORR071]
MAEDSQDLSTSRPLAEISHGPSGFEAFLDRNTKGLVVAAILMALAGGGVIVYRGLQEAAREEAGADLGKAATADELKTVITKHPDSPAAGSARMLLSDKQWADQDQDAAIQTLRDFLSKEPEHPAIPSAKAALASRLIQQGKGSDAESLLKELIDSPKARYLAPYALLALGDLAKTAGKADEADEYYKKIQEGYPQSPFNNYAGVHRKLVRFKMPTEIDAPPATTPPGAPGAGAGTLNIPGADKPDAPPPAGEGAGSPMLDILKGGNPVPAAPVEEDPKDAPKPQEAPPAPPVAPPPAESQPQQAPPP